MTTNKDRSSLRPTIYLSPVLMKVQDELKPGQTFSQRLAEIAERYEAISMYELPEHKEPNDLNILAEALSGTRVDARLIKYLDHEIEEAGLGDDSDEVTASYYELAGRIRMMTYAQRVALLEKAGL